MIIIKDYKSNDKSWSPPHPSRQEFRHDLQIRAARFSPCFQLMTELTMKRWTLIFVQIIGKKEQSDCHSHKRTKRKMVYKPDQARDWARERLGERGTGPSFVFSLLRESDNCIITFFVVRISVQMIRIVRVSLSLFRQLICAGFVCQRLKEKGIWVRPNIKILWRFWTSSLVAKGFIERVPFPFRISNQSVSALIYLRDIIILWMADIFF